jgi:homoserine dehydrogenase
MSARWPRRSAPAWPTGTGRDVGSHDAAATVMILSALVFGRQLRGEQVACRGITGIICCARGDDVAALSRNRALPRTAPGKHLRGRLMAQTPQQTQHR